MRFALRSLYPRRRNPYYLLNRGLCGLHRKSGRVDKAKNLFFPAGNWVGFSAALSLFLRPTTVSHFHVHIYIHVPGLSFIAAQSTAALAHGTRAFAGTCSDSCGAQDTDKRNALYNKNICISLCLSENVTELYCYIERYATTGMCTVLYCTVLYCTVLYSIVLYCTVLYCTVRPPRPLIESDDTIRCIHTTWPPEDEHNTARNM